VIVGAAALTIAIAIGTIKGVIGAFSKKWVVRSFFDFIKKLYYNNYRKLRKL
jgi:ABC-type dipeptide/oligopeptide/nickel transport system permease subunit